MGRKRKSGVSQVENTDTFDIGDYVFAKMKGFPPWPGRVQVPPSDVPVPKSRPLCVFFYGTHDISFYTHKDLISFDENVAEYGKPLPTKGPTKYFNLAMWEIEVKPEVEIDWPKPAYDVDVSYEDAEKAARAAVKHGLEFKGEPIPPEYNVTPNPPRKPARIKLVDPPRQPPTKLARKSAGVDAEKASSSSSKKQAPIASPKVSSVTKDSQKHGRPAVDIIDQPPAMEMGNIFEAMAVNNEVVSPSATDDQVQAELDKMDESKKEELPGVAGKSKLDAIVGKLRQIKSADATAATPCEPPIRDEDLATEVGSTSNYGAEVVPAEWPRAQSDCEVRSEDGVVKTGSDSEVKLAKTEQPESLTKPVSPLKEMKVAGAVAENPHGADHVFTTPSSPIIKRSRSSGRSTEFVQPILEQLQTSTECKGHYISPPAAVLLPDEFNVGSHESIQSTPTPVDLKQAKHEATKSDSQRILTFNVVNAGEAGTSQRKQVVAIVKNESSKVKSKKTPKVEQPKVDQPNKPDLIVKPGCPPSVQEHMRMLRIAWEAGKLAIELHNSLLTAEFDMDTAVKILAELFEKMKQGILTKKMIICIPHAVYEMRICRKLICQRCKTINTDHNDDAIARLKQCACYKIRTLGRQIVAIFCQWFDDAGLSTSSTGDKKWIANYYALVRLFMSKNPKWNTFYHIVTNKPPSAEREEETPQAATAGTSSTSQDSTGSAPTSSQSSDYPSLPPDGSSQVGPDVNPSSQTNSDTSSTINSQLNSLAEIAMQYNDTGSNSDGDITFDAKQVVPGLHAQVFLPSGSASVDKYAGRAMIIAGPQPSSSADIDDAPDDSDFINNDVRLGAAVENAGLDSETEESYDKDCAFDIEPLDDQQKLEPLYPGVVDNVDVDTTTD